MPRTRRELIASLVIVAIIIAAFAVVGALTSLSDRPGLEPWKAWTAAASSGLAAFVLIWIPWLATRRAMPGSAGWGRLLVVHLIAGLAYSALHVAGFVLVRNLIYAIMGEHYGLDPLIRDFPYELRKDLLTYGCNVGVFWIAGTLQPSVAPTDRPRLFDIRDSGRIIRVEIHAILAARSVGNYVEIMLDDGRRPLMRSTLAAIEAELASGGLLRVHRSWIVNPRRVTALRPDGSGDWTITLGEAEAPLSRRYRPALEQLRATSR